MSETKVRTNLRMRGSLTFEQVEEFDPKPKLGQTAFKDGILYIYAEVGGIKTWYPTNRPQSSYVHSQGLPSLEWIIEHNLNTVDVLVGVYDSSSHAVMADIKILDDKRVKISLTEPVEGHAVVFGRETMPAPYIKTKNIEAESIILRGKELYYGDPWGHSATETQITYNADGKAESMAEVVNGEPRSTQFIYADGQLIETMTVFRGRIRVETFTYSNGLMTASSAQIVANSASADAARSFLLGLSGDDAPILNDWLGDEANINAFKYIALVEGLHSLSVPGGPIQAMLDSERAIEILTDNHYLMSGLAADQLSMSLVVEDRTTLSYFLSSPFIDAIWSDNRNIFASTLASYIESLPTTKQGNYTTVQIPIDGSVVESVSVWTKVTNTGTAYDGNRMYLRNSGDLVFNLTDRTAWTNYTSTIQPDDSLLEWQQEMTTSTGFVVNTDPDTPTGMSGVCIQASYNGTTAPGRIYGLQFKRR